MLELKPVTLMYTDEHFKKCQDCIYFVDSKNGSYHCIHPKNERLTYKEIFPCKLFRTIGGGSYYG